MACVACKGRNIKLLYPDFSDAYYPDVPGLYQVQRCVDCDLFFVDPQPTPEQLAKHYPDNYPVYTRNKTVLSNSRKRITRWVANQFLGYGKPSWWRFVLFPLYPKLAHLPRYKKDGVLLDVGCGPGSRFPSFELLGWNVRGIEMNAGAAKAGRERGYDITCSSFEEAKLEDGSLDVIYTNHVFEHFLDPVAVLRKARKVLRPGGEFILNVPNGKGIASRLFGRRWYGLEVPRHTFTYNPKNIRQLLESEGFVVRSITPSFSLGSMSSSLAYVMGKRVDAFAWIDRPLWLLDLFFDVALYPFRISDWMTVHAVRD